MEEIDENKNIKENDINFIKNFEKDDDLIINMNPISDITRNRNINLLEDEKEIDNKKISNTYNFDINNDISCKKKVSFEDEILCISYNDTDKPTKLNVYKVVDKVNWMGIEIEFKPKITKKCINNLKSNKLIKSILVKKKINGNKIKKDNNKIVSFSNKTTKSKKLYKTLNKNNNNIINKNIELIKLIEKKVKKNSLEKNKDSSQKKDKMSNKKSIKDDTKENTLKNGIIINKELLDSIKKNDSEKKIDNNYLCQDEIQEEELINGQ
jgi:hypothetical protein